MGQAIDTYMFRFDNTIDVYGTVLTLTKFVNSLNFKVDLYGNVSSSTVNNHSGLTNKVTNTVTVTDNSNATKASLNQYSNVNHSNS